MNWFEFHFSDFALSFLSILLEGVPFLLLGTLVSGLVDAFIPSRTMLRFLPKNPVVAILVSALLGLVFPMCECGIVPVIRRLLRKGLPLSCGLAYMLAAPIVNPVVAISTYAAFRGQSPELMTAMRLILGFLIAAGAAFVVYPIRPEKILSPRMLGLLPNCRRTGLSIEGDGLGVDALTPAPAGLKAKFATAVRVSAVDFLDVAFYLVLGAAMASVFNTAVKQQEVILPFAANTPMAVFGMMVLAGLLSLCSTSDAFIAASFSAFPAAAKLAFLVFGPMFDLKLLFLYTALFRKRFVIALALALFVAVGLACIKISTFFP